MEGLGQEIIRFLIVTVLVSFVFQIVVFRMYKSGLIRLCCSKKKLPNLNYLKQKLFILYDHAGLTGTQLFPDLLSLPLRPMTQVEELMLI